MKRNGVEFVEQGLGGHPDLNRFNHRAVDSALRAYLTQRNIRTDGQLVMEKINRQRRRRP